jgi:hypothetical protein
VRWLALRIRPNIFLVSSLLLTPGLLWVLPYAINLVEATDPIAQTAGLASLTVIIVALIVIWTWLAAGNRVAWIIMAIIVWVWALFIMTGPILHHGRRWTLSELREWVVFAWRGDTLFARRYLISSVLFLLMLVGLILPVRALFRTRTALAPD